MRFKKRGQKYKDGQYLVESDLTGRICYSEDIRKLWNGLLCHKDEFEIRNPQDFILARPERQPMREVRPRSVEFLTEPVNPDDFL